METSPETPIAFPCRWIHILLKRAVDVVGAMTGLFVLAPLLILIAVVVKLTSPGKVFYRGVRAGLFGKPFRIFKFRTMVEDAESLGGPTTGTNDNRVTRIGVLLRRTKLDELPQLLNVLVGDMSLVGPRPEVLEYIATYKNEEKIILSMRPGITDYASIEFANLDDLVGNIDPDRYFREKIMPRKTELRVKYVKEWSLGSDFNILWMTLCRVVKRTAIR
ncbi:MAG: sugar transferase [Smithellaceae bacterium]|jgi:lipopolysaccharide/colanic/teichoic acid biosynthesis glycosyltransferase